MKLYLIEILHQTTTLAAAMHANAQLYLIEILHQTTTRFCILFPVYRLYLIEILHQTTTLRPAGRRQHGCILSKFYIKPQQFAEHKIWINVVSYRNSTSNHNIIPLTRKKVGVVSYRNSTSNHNNITIVDNVISVVSYRNSTSNHNDGRQLVAVHQLYLIEILHQTTTKDSAPATK